MGYTLHLGDCIEVMRGMDDCSVDACITDPPYGLSKEPDAAEVLRHWLAGDRYEHGGGGFMGKSWDSFVPGPEYWREVYRVMKPGAHLLCFSGTRTWDLMSMAIRLAGFENRDTIAHFGVPALAWVTGQGFPKSLAIDKAIDRMRDDADPVLAVTRWLNQQVKRAGVRYADILAHFGFNEGSGQIGHWTALSIGAQPAVPTWDQWLQLKALLNFGDDMDAEVWRLNGRKGKPGEAWYERELLEERTMIQGGGTSLQLRVGERREVEANITAPATDAAKKWAGWGSALKPSFEVVLVFRRPLAAKNIAANVLAWSTGAINVDACRISLVGGDQKSEGGATPLDARARQSGFALTAGNNRDGLGRWPPNAIFSHAPTCTPRGVKRVKGNWRADKGIGLGYHGGDAPRGAAGPGDIDHTEQVAAWDCDEAACPVRELDRQSGVSRSPKTYRRAVASGNKGVYSKGIGEMEGADSVNYGDIGGSSRFFPTFPADPPDVPFRYVSKASRRERNEGCAGLPERSQGQRYGTVQDARPHTAEGYEYPRKPMQNGHPTVKPLALMEWLCKLITPPGPDSVILDPFAGSGSTGVAALRGGFSFVGVEQSEEYHQIAERRLQAALSGQMALPLGAD